MAAVADAGFLSYINQTIILLKLMCGYMFYQRYRRTVPRSVNDEVAKLFQLADIETDDTREDLLEKNIDTGAVTVKKAKFTNFQIWMVKALRNKLTQLDPIKSNRVVVHKTAVGMMENHGLRTCDVDRHLNTIVDLYFTPSKKMIARRQREFAWQTAKAASEMSDSWFAWPWSVTTQGQFADQ